ncbi:MAG: zinc-ribbon domain containing protein [Candidatus Wallbacteria bacterium]|nr:zinc-ribbon domain containing protein [Candidatus Wallbacteria bacterium]
MPFEDKKVICRDCGKEFIFSAGEQEFFAQKGFTNAPSRCKPCNANRKASAASGEGTSAGGAGAGPRQMHDVTCDKCGKQTRVPFRPTGRKPVYCKECFQEMR